jgi:hypothetical protein
MQCKVEKMKETDIDRNPGKPMQYRVEKMKETDINKNQGKPMQWNALRESEDRNRH